MDRIWTLQEAETQFAGIADAAPAGEPQRVATEGAEAVIVLSAEDYEPLAKRPKTLVQHLMDAPVFPDAFHDLFDKREPMVIEIRDIALC
ncbi:type II toxin-antitoxin system prevent-host-death family antitoxin [Mangrovicella endophytica]|uniref:type II toxin-antitoxin system prevent-host-death family antitoxin n=1 Tax=Mangrovicella endophytica TaxID=2066697 RepID=UPI000C9DC696|nr:type II toxin-antitoxin system prevent-host-death family antitoxin [Mangrovicella endophytica]